MTKSKSGRLLFVALGLAAGLVSEPGVAAASSWTSALGAGSKAQAQSQGVPAAPSPVSAACTSSSGKTIKVTWSAVTHASTYSIYKSTVSASSGYAVAASGITTTSWTSATLSNATYWFEVSDIVGANWVSPNSAATGSHTITSSGCT